MRKSNAGFIVLLIKLGPKLLPILAKMQDALWAAVKSLFGIKGAGLAGSVGLYSYLFTWQMGIAIVVFIAIHEYGHVWAMKRCGIKTKGMFFIPGFGAVAIAEERFGSARNEAYIAIMGPVFGLVGFVFPLGVLYYQTGEPLWAAIAALMAFINLVNLFPINPLDGGRILKALAYSERLAASLVITVAISVVTAFLGAAAGFVLLAYMALLGIWEIAVAFGIHDRIKGFLVTMTRGMVAATFIFTMDYFVKEVGRYGVDEKPHSAIWLSVVGAALMSMAMVAIFDIKTGTIDKGRSVLAYPIAVAGEMWQGIRQILGLRAHHLQPIENYERMRLGAKLWYAICFLVLVLVHVVAIVVLSKAPGADLAKELLR